MGQAAERFIMQTLAKQGTQHCGSDQCLFNFVKRALKPADIIGNGLRHITWQSGQLVYQQGEPAYSCYWLCKGQIELIRRNRWGKQQIIRFVRAGELFGLEALIGLEVHEQDARVISACQSVAVEGQNSLLALLGEPAFAAALIKAVVKGFLNVKEQLKLFSAPGPQGRIAQGLLLLTDCQDGGGGAIDHDQ